MFALPGGFRPRKRLDQYFLVDRRILQIEADLAKLDRRDLVLEIGAGNGGLTRIIAEKAGKVIAVEKDRTLVAHLAESCPQNVEVIQGDALKVEFPPFNKVVGNVPYSVSSPLVFRLLDHGFELGVLCFQREFARRMVARPGESEYSRLSVVLALRTRKVSLALEVPRRAFSPVPRVDSTVVVIVPRRSSEPDEVTAQVIRILFCHKRKTLANAVKSSDAELRRLYGLASRDVREGLIAPWERRVVSMTPDEILDFSRSFRLLLDSKRA